ncbi:hypothetical protein EJB05_20932, partial [Eragrostis curvula]
MARVSLAVLAALLLLVDPCHARPEPEPEPEPTEDESFGTTLVDGIGVIYNFGDSLSDTGNLLLEGDASGMLNYTTSLPYGSSIGEVTGRCSDGFLMIDFLATDLDLPCLDPYLEAAPRTARELYETGYFARGANFAVAGATTLDAAALARRGVVVPHTRSSLAVQLQWFKDLMISTNEGRPNTTMKDIRETLSYSLVMLGEIGGNDYNYAFATSLKPAQAGGGGGRRHNNFGRRAVTKAMALVPDVVRAITNTARELLDMGATRLVIPGNLPLGCVPIYLSAANEKDPKAYDANGCLVGLNTFAQMHNAELQKGIKRLRALYPAAKIAYADYFGAYVQMLRNATEMGFDKGSVTRACCGTGGGKHNVDLDRMCGSPGATVCATPDRYISWDGVHLTQRAYRVMTDLIYHEGFASPAPIEFPPRASRTGRSSWDTVSWNACL